MSPVLRGTIAMLNDYGEEHMRVVRQARFRVAQNPFALAHHQPQSHPTSSNRFDPTEMDSSPLPSRRGQVEVHAYVLGDVVRDALESACVNRRAGRDDVYRLFGHELQRQRAPDPHAGGTWRYVLLLNRGEALSLLHVDGLAHAGDSYAHYILQPEATPTIPRPRPRRSRGPRGPTSECRGR